jgi:hypothetical protein
MAFEVGAPDAPSGVSLYTQALGRAVCARVAGGESLRRIGAEAGWPTPQTVWNWARAEPVFAEALAAAQKAARVASRLRDRDAQAEREARRDPKRPGPASTYHPAWGAEICRRLAEGESLVSIARDPDMPRTSTVLEWVTRHADFEDMYVVARRMQADHLADEVREVGLATTPGTVWADRLRFDTLRWLTARLAPKKYCEKIMVAEAVRAEAAPGNMTVIVKRYSDVTPEEIARADEGEP